MKMNRISFYDQMGIIIPGAIFMFGLFFYVPDLRALLTTNGISVGGFGIFVLISYAVGHILAAVGNLLEAGYWRWKGGMPSNWVVGPQPRLLSASQIAKLHTQVASRLGIHPAPLAELTAQAWFPIFRQMYSDVEKHGKPGRGDTFNGVYGLNRGLAAATLALAITILVLKGSDWYISAGLVVASGVYLYRMQRFGVHYAREIYNQFLLLPAQPGKPSKPPPAGNAAESAGKEP